MKGKLNILLVFSEVAPFSRSSALGDVGGALPKALKEMGHDIRVITPQYRGINERKYILRDVIRLQKIEIPLGNKTLTIDVKSAFIPNSKVQVYFIDYKPFFFREGLYSDIKTKKGYSDNDKRFILFAKGVLKTLDKLQWQPDVIHCHDWQSGLIPFFLNTIYKDDPFFKKTYTLFTAHQFGPESQFSPDCFGYMSEGAYAEFPEDEIVYQGQCSFMKAGIGYADIVNTIRVEHADESQSSTADPGLNEDARSWRKDRFYHIANGIDYDVWNPESDSYIKESFTPSDFKGKEVNKKALTESLELPLAPATPIIGMLTSLSDKRGVELVESNINELMGLGFYFIVACDGVDTTLRLPKQMNKKYADRLRVQPSSDESMVHRLIAGADMMLIPLSRGAIESSHLFCLKYGTVPIVHIAKGMDDAFRAFDSNTGKGMGFIFQDLKARSMLKTIKKAIRMFDDQKVWQKIMKNGMREDLSWQHAAKKYVQLYNKCITKKK